MNPSTSVLSQTSKRPRSLRCHSLWRWPAMDPCTYRRGCLRYRHREREGSSYALGDICFAGTLCSASSDSMARSAVSLHTPRERWKMWLRMVTLPWTLLKVPDLVYMASTTSVPVAGSTSMDILSNAGVVYKLGRDCFLLGRT
jgi:hypothetical protein